MIAFSTGRNKGPSASGSDGTIRNSFSDALGDSNERKFYRSRIGDQRSDILLICIELRTKSTPWQAEAVILGRQRGFSRRFALFGAKQVPIDAKFRLIAITAMLKRKVALC